MHCKSACVAVDEVKDIRDKAEAMKAYARQANDTEMTLWAAEIKLTAERKAGELLGVMKVNGERPSGRKKESHDVTLNDIGISNKESSHGQQAGEVPEQVFEDYIQQSHESQSVPTSAAVSAMFCVHFTSGLRNRLNNRHEAPR